MIKTETNPTKDAVKNTEAISVNWGIVAPNGSKFHTGTLVSHQITCILTIT